MNVGMIGLGKMGLGMGARLVEHGRRVTGFDASPDKAADAISETSGTHPCRAVIVRADDSADARPGATVSAVCGITKRGDRRLCGEIIRLRAPAGSDTTGMALPLLAPDVPFYLWAPAGSMTGGRGLAR